MIKSELVSDNVVQPLGESQRSAVSWGAIIAGAVIGAALTITLITGGTGLGLISVSPWQNDGASGSTLAIGTIVWLLATQIIAYGVAGYVTGRLRTKWTNVIGDEIYFRDTAHGFVVWALSSVVGFVLLSSAAASIVSGTAQTGATMVGAGAGAATQVAEESAKDNDMLSLDYFTDTLLRPNDPSEAYYRNDNRKEITTILTRSLAQGEMTQQDEDYLVAVIAKRADMSEMQARERLQQVTADAKLAASELEAKVREAADEARKAAAVFALWAFASLLLGAFVASFAATIGGRARDL
ncbi:hypothetical protein [Oceanisphaera avium]|uniref:Mll5186 protein n=1 Tax=Oceanisphaera avium TaxID=1903694 RepID=A0A1Y0CVR5_9GAMM|nr:hypothetical protein [Oceanisphaera avium]ART79421.1 hypothetical protein CBP12_04025 [Oceanisphaera avium]